MLFRSHDENITHVEGSVDPLRDKEIIDFELKLKDLETIEKRKEKISRAAKTGDKNSIIELNLLEKLITIINDGNSINSSSLSVDENNLIKSMSLLSIKPVLYVCNVDEKNIKSPSDELKSIVNNLKTTGSNVIVLAAKTEEEIKIGRAHV